MMSPFEENQKDGPATQANKKFMYVVAFDLRKRKN